MVYGSRQVKPDMLDLAMEVYAGEFIGNIIQVAHLFPLKNIFQQFCTPYSAGVNVIKNCLWLIYIPEISEDLFVTVKYL